MFDSRSASLFLRCLTNFSLQMFNPDPLSTSTHLIFLRVTTTSIYKGILCVGFLVGISLWLKAMCSVGIMFSTMAWRCVGSTSSGTPNPWRVWYKMFLCTFEILRDPRSKSWQMFSQVSLRFCTYHFVGLMEKVQESQGGHALLPRRNPFPWF